MASNLVRLFLFEVGSTLIKSKMNRKLKRGKKKGLKS